MQTRSNNWRKTGLGGLGIFLASLAFTFILFGGTLRAGYVLDDHGVVEGRTELRQPEQLKTVFLLPWHPAAPWAGNWRPLTLYSFALNFIFSERAGWLHLVNLLLQAANVTLVYYLVKRLASRPVAVLTALLFLFLPIHGEPVASIVGRSDLLGACFMLLALLLFYQRRYWGSSASFLLALLAKDFSIALLPVVGVLLLLETRNFWHSVKLGLIYLLPLPLYFWLRYLALGQYAFGGYGYIDPVIGPLAFLPWPARMLTGLRHWWLYLRKSFLPYDLSPDYSYNQIPAITNLFHSATAMLGALLLIGAAMLFYYGNKPIRVALALVVIPWLIMSNIFFITTGTFAERWWYFPSLGLCLLAALGLAKLVDYWKLQWPVRRWGRAITLGGSLALLLFWYGWLIARSNAAWQDDRTLYFYALARSPDSVGARTNAAAIYFKERNYAKASEQINAALAIYDKNPATLNLAGKLAWHDGRYGEAETDFRRGIEFDSRQRNARNFYRLLAFLKLDQGENQAALGYIKQAVDAPRAGIKDNVISTDLVFYQLIKKVQGRTIASYTPNERATLLSFLQLVRGF